MGRTIRRLLAALGVAAAILVVSGAASAQELTLPTDGSEVSKLVRFWALERLFIDLSEPVPLKPVLNHRLLTKAEPDQCYLGLETPSIPAASGSVPCTRGVDKTNQAYVWGLAKSNGYLYFGTLANTHCLVSDAYLGMATPQENPYWVCGFTSQANSPYGSDWRPPRLYRFKLPSGPLEELSAKANLGEALEPKLTNTTGIRSAGAFGGVVFFAGPALRTAGTGGINVFAFDGATGNLLAKKRFTEYTDIRQWLVAGNVLYTTVGTPTGGEVLRWRGSNSTDPAVVMNFEPVGDLDGAGAYLEMHEGRIYISTWPTGSYAGIVRGPVVPPDGLSEVHRPASNWVKIWDVSKYDPDPVAARATGGGALASYRGDLYWGTMHVPFLGATSAERAYCPQGKPCGLDANGNGTYDTNEALTTALGAHRSIAIFRARHPEAAKVNVDIVYGEYFLPKYDAAKKSYTIAYDAAHMNVAKKMPQHGASGFGNFWNAYTWTMSVFNGSLFIGTFDFSELARVGIEDALNQGEVSMTPRRFAGLEKLLGSNFPIIEGADIFRIDASGGKARGETFDGLGNFTNYGVRTVLVDQAANKMYYGSANPMNLHPLGGWELIETTRRAR